MTLHPYIKFPRAGTALHPWKVPDVCALYGWPKGLPGRGRIGIVELGGGYLRYDIVAFFSRIGQTPPKLTDVSVDDTVNSPGVAADYEVSLDIQLAGAAFHVATGQPADIVVLWARDIAPAVAKAAALGCAVCCISWGAAEREWGKAAALAMDAAARDATQMGTLVLAASGDNNSSDGDAGANVDLPAGCPHVLGCGGTTLTRAGETVWNNDPGQTTGSGSGGGYSRYFARPAWQIGAPSNAGRMVPDIAANADPYTGYHIVVRGLDQVVGGTSAVPPLMGGLLAACRPLGFATPTLYTNPAKFRDITVGDNGQWRAMVGPDPCTGLGSPHAALLAALLA